MPRICVQADLPAMQFLPPQPSVLQRQAGDNSCRQDLENSIKMELWGCTQGVGHLLKWRVAKSKWQHQRLSLPRCVAHPLCWPWHLVPPPWCVHNTSQGSQDSQETMRSQGKKMRHEIRCRIKTQHNNKINMNGLNSPIRR